MVSLLTTMTLIKGRVNLKAHQYQEHYENPNIDQLGDVGDKHVCRVCLKLFTRKSDVKAHILRIHMAERRYPCTMCDKRFKESTHLRKHLRTHTGKFLTILINSFPCDFETKENIFKLLNYITRSWMLDILLGIKDDCNIAAFQERDPISAIPVKKASKQTQILNVIKRLHFIKKL